MTDPVNLNERRAIAKADSREWTAIDCLKAMIRDLESGEIKCDQMAIHWFDIKEDKSMHHHYSVSGMTFTDHLALLEVAKFSLMEEWRK